MPSLRPSLEQATTIFDVFPQIMAIVAEQEARFPESYEFSDPDATPEPGVITIDFGQSGAEFCHLRAFDTLNTCEGIPEWESPEPEAD